MRLSVQNTKNIQEQRSENVCTRRLEDSRVLMRLSVQNTKNIQKSSAQKAYVHVTLKITCIDASECVKY